MATVETSDGAQEVLEKAAAKWAAKQQAEDIKKKKIDLSGAYKDEKTMLAQFELDIISDPQERAKAVQGYQASMKGNDKLTDIQRKAAMWSAAGQWLEDSTSSVPGSRKHMEDNIDGIVRERYERLASSPGMLSGLVKRYENLTPAARRDAKHSLG